MKKARFNVVDAIIIIAVLLLITAAYFYLRSGGFGGGNNVKVYYTIEFEGLPKGFHELVNKGVGVKDSVKGYYLGVIDGVEVRPSTDWRLNEEERRYELFTFEDEEIMRVTIVGNGTESDAKITAEEDEVRVGKLMHIEGKGFVLSGYIVDVRTEGGR